MNIFHQKLITMDENADTKKLNCILYTTGESAAEYYTFIDKFDVQFNTRLGAQIAYYTINSGFFTVTTEFGTKTTLAQITADQYLKQTFYFFTINLSEDVFLKFNDVGMIRIHYGIKGFQAGGAWATGVYFTTTSQLYTPPSPPSIKPQTIINGISAQSFFNTKINDEMTTEEFRKIASERLETKRVRTDEVIIDFDTNGAEKTIWLTELQDNKMATAYIKRCNAFITTEGAPSIKVIDDFKGQNKTIYESITEDLRPTFVGMFANKLVINGIVKGQVIVYTAERSN